MKKNQVTVTVNYDIERTRSGSGSVLMLSPFNVVVPRSYYGDYAKLIESIEVSSLLNAHPRGRCAHVVIKGFMALPNGSRAMSTRYFIEMAKFDEVADFDKTGDGCYWRLAKGREFLEEAVGIMEIVLARLGARYWNDHPNLTSHRDLMKTFGISQTTFVRGSDLRWRPLAEVIWRERYCEK